MLSSPPNPTPTYTDKYGILRYPKTVSIHIVEN